MRSSASKKLLLIEDNPGDSRLIKETLRTGAGGEFELREAVDLATGLSIAESEKIEALLLDLALPDSVGLETFQKVHEVVPGIPVIILSGTTDEELALEAVRVGAQDYFVKGSIDANILVRSLRYAIERSRRERDLEIIASVTYALRATQEPAEIIAISLQHAMNLLDAQAGAIMLLDSSKENLIIQQAMGRWKQHTGKHFAIADTVTGDVVASGQAFFETDLQKSEDPRLVFYKELDTDLCALVIVPMIAEDETIGVFVLGDEKDVEEHDFSSFMTLANIVANNFHRATLYEQTQRQLERLNSLRTIDLAINTSFDLSVILDVFLDQLTMQLDIDAAAILLLDPLNVLRYKAGRGFRTMLIQETALRFGEGYAGKAIKDRSLVELPVISEAAQASPRAALFKAEGFKAYFAVSLEAKGKVIGALEVFHRARMHPPRAWLDFFETLAGQAAIAIQNAEMFEHLREAKQDLEIAYDATLEGWVHALELRDDETVEHTQRVTRMCIDLVKLIGFKDEDLPNVWRGALLHDIGKMGVPDSILLKRDELTSEEREIMKMHPSLARDLIYPVEYLRSSIDIPLYHHEKWDGTGYPYGLQGEQIPLVARIFAVADVWDALTSDRPYRKACSQQKALEYIRKQSGRHFDPSVVDVFLRLIASNTEDLRGS